VTKPFPYNSAMKTSKITIVPSKLLNLKKRLKNLITKLYKFTIRAGQEYIPSFGLLNPLYKKGALPSKKYGLDPDNL